MVLPSLKNHLDPENECLICLEDDMFFFATAGTASCWGSDLHVGFHMAFEHPPFDSKVRSIYIDVF